MAKKVDDGKTWTVSGTDVATGEDSTLTEWQTNNLLRQPAAQKVFESLIGPFYEVCDPIPKSRCLRTFDQRKSQALMTFEEGLPGEWRT